MKGLVVNSRIINTFRKKIWLLKSKVEQMSYFVGIEFDMKKNRSKTNKKKIKHDLRIKLDQKRFSPKRTR